MQKRRSAKSNSKCNAQSSPHMLLQETGDEGVAAQTRLAPKDAEPDVDLTKSHSDERALPNGSADADPDVDLTNGSADAGPALDEDLPPELAVWQCVGADGLDFGALDGLDGLGGSGGGEDGGCGTPPRIVFVVPYRHRPQQKYFFLSHMRTVLETAGLLGSVEIYFAHQCDARTFNRGATKNIGFLAVKDKYPLHYQDMTFVFHDLDTLPYTHLFDYATVSGVVKHFYGFTYALGGIVAMTGADFERTNGYPNFWGWGMEDNVLQKRCEKLGLAIDRSHFYPIGHPNILHLFDGISRIINRKDPWRAEHDRGLDGLKTIHKLKYTVDHGSPDPADHEHTISAPYVHYVNITAFMTGVQFEQDEYHHYDLREPPRKILHPSRLLFQGGDMLSAVARGRDRDQDRQGQDHAWSHIPFYPTAEQRQAMAQQYGADAAEEIIQYSYAHSTDPTREVVPAHLQHAQRPLHPLQQTQRPQRPQTQQTQHQGAWFPPNMNKFSAGYARVMGVKPRATTSATIRLGGVVP